MSDGPRRADRRENDDFQTRTNFRLDALEEQSDKHDHVLYGANGSPGMIEKVAKLLDADAYRKKIEWLILATVIVMFLGLVWKIVIK